MIGDKKQDFEKIIEILKSEFSKLRTGRANTGLVEDLKVDYYGQKLPLKGVASISLPEPRQLVINPWDKNALMSIEKAIQEANLGLNPVNEGDKLRIAIPELTEERRKDLVKIAGRSAEEARIKVRTLREEIWKEIKRQEEAGEISEDEKFRQQEKLQEMVDEHNKKIKELLERKEKEIMTI